MARAVQKCRGYQLENFFSRFPFGLKVFWLASTVRIVINRSGSASRWCTTKIHGDRCNEKLAGTETHELSNNTLERDENSEKHTQDHAPMSVKRRNADCSRFASQTCD